MTSISVVFATKVRILFLIHNKNQEILSFIAHKE